MAEMYLREDNTLSGGNLPYSVKVQKAWFRGKDCFTERLSFYERELVSVPEIDMPLNAGNMIYVMMQRLEVGEWDKQTALMSAYRNLVYRLSYTHVMLSSVDAKYLTFFGKKSDVKWTLSFLSQVFFEEPMLCMSIPSDLMEPPMAFAIRNGVYVGKNEVLANQKEALPDIWATDDVVTVDKLKTTVVYDPFFVPKTDETFAIPDGRVAKYVRMDERFYIAKKEGMNCSPLTRHNITASLIKDFEDMIHTQTKASYDVYQLRYTAFMNKVHDLEKRLGGLEPTAYDVLPIAERGLPLAEKETISRTNALDRNSLKYIYDTMRSPGIAKTNIALAGKNAVTSVLQRQRGYETEYRMYIATGSTEECSAVVFRKYMAELYNDFGKLDMLRKVVFPPKLYQSLCNVPASGISVMTDWERQRIRLFGRGYLDFLKTQIDASPAGPKKKYWMSAKQLVDERYLRN